MNKLLSSQMILFMKLQLSIIRRKILNKTKSKNREILNNKTIP
jgi:hypothetical protein